MADNISIKDGSGATVVVRSTDVAGVEVNMSIPTNTAGTAAAFGSGANGATVPRVALATDSPGIITTGTAGSPSAQVLTIQGIASGTVVPVSLTSTTITGTVAATQSGAWTVQPGNTPNTTAWLTTQNQKFGAAQLTSAVISTASSGDTTLITRAVGTIKVYGIVMAAASSVVATLKNGASGVTGAMTLNSLFLPISAEPYFTTTSTNNFVLTLGSAVQCSGTIYYIDS